MTLPRRQFLRLAAGAAAAAVSVSPRIARAQAWPARPVRILVGYPAGGVTDITARLIGQWLSERLGQPFIVEDRGGAASNIATEVVARAPADGYTLLMATSTNAINATVYERLSFNFSRDLAPVANVNEVPLVMEVHPSFPTKTVPAFIAYAKANPGKLSMASAGIGTVPHVAGELFKLITGINMIHVPYRGDSPASADLIANHVQVYFGTLGGAIEYLRAGQLRALAVASAARLEVLPDVPTLSDFLPGFEASTWNGLVAPKDTPAEIIDKLNQATNAALADPKLKARFYDLGAAIVPESPAEFRKVIADDTEKWAKVVKFAGIKAD
jgi:tripartite-type tricarboxylate transporter receptor subunit TctC